MFRRVLPIMVLSTLSGCSFVLDTSDFRGGGDGGAGQDADAVGNPPDAGAPPGCRVDALDPVEGTTVPVILTGEGFGTDTVVQASLGGMDIAPDDVLVNAAGTKIGAVFTIPVMTDLGTGASRSLHITAAPAGKPCAVDLAVQGLSELVIEDESIDTGDLVGKRFSTITVSNPLTLTGTEPARFVATNAIRINAPVSADGQSATGSAGAKGGPGSCGGGSETENGNCDAGGGGAGGSASPTAGVDGQGSGGGGGNCAVQNSNDGEGPSGGQGGATSCSEPLVPLGTAGNHGNGGGGGGRGASAAGQVQSGGGGGGGGGVIEITAPLIVFNDSVTANGGLGATIDNADCNISGGSGGGGSGGAIIVRGQQIVAAKAEPLEARGGFRGDGCVRGGSGSRGRIRVDAADGTTPDMLVPSNAAFTWQGPMLAPDTPRVVGAARLIVNLVGDPGLRYEVGVGAGTPVEGDGDGLVTVMLESGLNTVCALVKDVDQTRPEAKNCLTIALVD